MPTYTDKNGYKRHSNLVHRQIAYEQIYKKNRDEYPLPFSEYVVHHIDGNKLNNNVDNLQILTPEEHERVHGLGKSNLPYFDALRDIYPERNSIFLNFFIFHIMALIIFWMIGGFLIIKIFNLNGYLALISEFLSGGMKSIAVIMAGYFFLASWWIERIRKGFID